MLHLMEIFMLANVDCAQDTHHEYPIKLIN